MKFYVSSTLFGTEKPEWILHNYPCLKDYNYTIENLTCKRARRTVDENGKPIIQEVQFDVERLCIDIQDLEELMKLEIEVPDADLLIMRIDGRNELEIYDGPRE